jgi:hypothetical protein
MLGTGFILNAKWHGCLRAFCQFSNALLPDGVDQIPLELSYLNSELVGF